MNNQKIKLLLALSLCAVIAAIVCAVAAGSHFRFALGNGASNFDFAVGVESNGASNALGMLALVEFLAGLAAHLSTGSETGSRSDLSPFAWVSDIGGSLRRLTKSRSDSWVGGVCGGLGENTPIPSWVWRLGFLISLFCYGTGVLAYILLWICLPEPPPEPATQTAAPPNAA